MYHVMESDSATPNRVATVCGSDAREVRDENGLLVAVFPVAEDAREFVLAVNARDALRAALYAMYRTAMRVDDKVWRSAWLGTEHERPLDAACAALDMAIGQEPDEFEASALTAALAYLREVDGEDD